MKKNVVTCISTALYVFAKTYEIFLSDGTKKKKKTRTIYPDRPDGDFTSGRRTRRTRADGRPRTIRSGEGAAGKQCEK